MNITKANVGDILCRYKDGKRIMITDVGDKVIQFISESSSQPYKTKDKVFNGTLDYSHDAETFLDNLNFTRVMDYAEASALHKVLSGDAQEKEDGDYMLIAISKQREAFIEKINSQARARKDMLFTSFKQDYQKFNPKDKVVFYGAIVEKPEKDDGYIINGKYYNKNSGELVLLGSDNPVKTAPSFNDLIDSALSRSTAKHKENTKNIDIEFPIRE